MSFENRPGYGIDQMHPLKTREVVSQDANNVCESLSRSDSMPRCTAPRRVIANPISGEQIVIHTSGAETDGQLLIFELFLPPSKHVPISGSHWMRKVLTNCMPIYSGVPNIGCGASRVATALPPGVCPHS